MHKKEEQGLFDADAPVMPLKVLVVDDDLTNRTIAKAILKRNGCETYEYSVK